jgi:hypothetical protein
MTADEATKGKVAMSTNQKLTVRHRALVLILFAMFALFGHSICALAADALPVDSPTAPTPWWLQLFREFLTGDSRLVERIILCAFAYVIVQQYTAGHKERDAREERLNLMVVSNTAAVTAGAIAANSAAEATRDSTTAMVASTAAYVEAQRGCREHQKVIVDALLERDK